MADLLAQRRENSRLKYSPAIARTCAVCRKESACKILEAALLNDLKIKGGDCNKFEGLKKC